jgi:hypothetical protein
VESSAAIPLPTAGGIEPYQEARRDLRRLVGAFDQRGELVVTEVAEAATENADATQRSPLAPDLVAWLEHATDWEIRGLVVAV